MRFLVRNNFDICDYLQRCLVIIDALTDRNRVRDLIQELSLQVQHSIFLYTAGRASFIVEWL